MTATSATGKGLGSADKKNKGSEHLTIGANKIIGPRVVACGSGTLDGSGDLTIILPLPTGVIGDYMVFTTDANATAATATACTMTFVSNGLSLVFKGTAAQPINYLVVKKGLAV
jgi:hypothetical protein